MNFPGAGQYDPQTGKLEAKEVVKLMAPKADQSEGLNLERRWERSHRGPKWPSQEMRQLTGQRLGAYQPRCLLGPR